MGIAALRRVMKRNWNIVNERIKGGETLVWAKASSAPPLFYYLTRLQICHRANGKVRRNRSL